MRPVGLIRSPITQNGSSKPMTTVLVFDSITVRVMTGLRFGVQQGCQRGVGEIVDGDMGAMRPQGGGVKAGGQADHRAARARARP